jgi:hypothetical protein
MPRKPSSLSEGRRERVRPEISYVVGRKDGKGMAGRKERQTENV